MDMMTRDWRERHRMARMGPASENERLIVDLLDAINSYAITEEWPDGVLTPAMGQLLEGARTMLLRDLGRLDAGTLDDEIMTLARVVGWDLEVGSVIWDNGGDA